MGGEGSVRRREGRVKISILNHFPSKSEFCEATDLSSSRRRGKSRDFRIGETLFIVKQVHAHEQAKTHDLLFSSVLWETMASGNSAKSSPDIQITLDLRVEL